MFAGNFDNGEPRFIQGLANIKAICTSQAVSISQENGEFGTTGTTSHELAHNLGSLHDVLSDNSCDSKDQYIMSVAPGQLTPQTFMHPFYFSACSIDYMRQYLASEAVLVAIMRGCTVLGWSERNCLLKTSLVQPATPSSNIPSNTPPGQQFPINVQCQLFFGMESYYCGGMIYDEKMCSLLYCYDPLTSQCTTSTEYRAYTGTTCGNKKWCQQGSCVYDSAAPAASDVCLSGDTRDPLTKCWELMANDFSKCYLNDYYKKCCATCEYFKKKNSTDASCIYGDKQPEYCKGLKPSSCYNNQDLKLCCQTCKNFWMTDMMNCEYGDRASWCSDPSQMKASNCYNSENTCCLQCAKFNLQLYGCQYGDKIDCSFVTPDQCPSMADNCCIKCNPQYSSLAPSILKGINITLHSPPPLTKRFSNCNDGRPWCNNLPPFSCYDSTLKNSCPCVCQQMRVSADSNGFEYGDKYTWCGNITKTECGNLFSQGACSVSCLTAKDGSEHLTGSRKILLSFLIFSLRCFSQLLS
ncbi:hypothetical protein HELRODRAFT_188065 [Helobdella robusta]|uniref:Peptidase M12B domain-containing protein n=1 Tax=Helobdella robusta TaxID=6412 RepID=T1FPL5_HELRO|nr:hypothetical protein HELRODRAFT_188065 [Helobdella robusta]ESO13004.1 hypothetical protein HELRODRAFT_188065 [Helobdella robusta]